MDKIKLDILGLSSSQTQSSSFALVLGEEGGNRRLPIIIGMFEAQAIAIELEKITPNRPMTHDLFKSFSHFFEIDVKEIVISDLKEGVFFGKIVCQQDDLRVEIDARPSDAIAIGIRFGVDVYTYESVLSEAGIVLSDEEFDDTNEDIDLIEKADTKEAPRTFEEQLKANNKDELDVLLKEALEQEDYERAAKIRDELNNR